MKKINFNKKIVVGILLVLSLVVCTACGKTKDTENADTKSETINIAGYEVSEGELMMRATLRLLSGQLYYSDVVSDEASVKQSVINEIIDTKVVYDKAIAENMEFTESDEEVKQKLISSFKSYVPQDYFDAYGITDETIEKVFTEDCYTDKYENDLRNALGKELTEDYKNRMSDKNFVTVYRILFPTIEVDENDEPATDANGSYIQLSEEAKLEQKAKAEQAKVDLENGESYEAVVEKYGIEAYSLQQDGYIGMFGDALDAELETMEIGQCSSVYSSELGYYVLVLLTENDESVKEGYAYTLAVEYLDAKYNTIKNEWFAELASDSDAVTDSMWQDFSILDMATELNKRGLMQ